MKQRLEGGEVAKGIFATNNASVLEDLNDAVSRCSKEMSPLQVHTTLLAAS
jgi:hypothetical protein